MDEWCLSGHSVRKSQIVFFAQVILVYIVVISSIVNLSLNIGDKDVWIILLGSAVGYLLPSPSLKHDRILHQSSEQHPSGSQV
jgi:hypothetical protein